MMRVRICWIILLLATSAIVPLARADAQLWLVGEPSEGMPTCEEFFDQWEVPGVPAGILAMGGLGREVFAAQDCIAKNNVPMACKHWQGLLVVMDKIGPPLNESRGDIEQLMQEDKCEVAAESDAESAPETGPAAEPAPDVQSKPAPEINDAPEESPSSDK